MSQTISKSSVSEVKLESVSGSFQLTNNTQFSVSVISADVAEDNDESLIYNRSLTALSSTDGASLIKPGETKSISSANAEATIVIAKADNLFPVKVLDTATDIVLTNDDFRSMQLTEAFVQAIMAFPSSDMASGFATVLQTNDETQVATFLKAYPQYGPLTLNDIVAVQTYYNRYGFVWAGYAASQAFDIWTSPDGTTKKNLGTLTITNGVTAPVSNLMSPAGFTAVYMDQNHRKTNLVYTNGQFSEDANNPAPAICLQGIFVLLSQLTGLETDDRLVPAMFGTVNDAEIFGVSASYPVPKSGSVKLTAEAAPSFGTKDYFDSLGLFGWLKLAGIVVGVIAGVVALGLTLRYLYKRMSKPAPAPAPLTPEEIARRNRQKAQDAISRLDPEARKGLRVPDDLTKSIADVKRTATDRIASENWFKTSEVLGNQTRLAESLLKYGKNSAMDKVISNSYQDADLVGEVPHDISQHMPELMEHMKLNNAAITKRIGEVSKKLSETEAAALTEAKRATDVLTNRVAENERIRQDLMEDEILVKPEVPEIIE